MYEHISLDDTHYTIEAIEHSTFNTNKIKGGVGGHVDAKLLEDTAI